MNLDSAPGPESSDPIQPDLERLRSALAAGLAQADSGELLDGQRVIEELRSELREIDD